MKDANGKEVLEVELPTAREDVDSLWAASQSALRHKPPAEKEHRGTYDVYTYFTSADWSCCADAETKQADHDRNSRTNVVLAWVGTNMYALSNNIRFRLSNLPKWRD